MRLAMAFVLSWFGIQELRSPAEWAVFVPNFVSDHSPIAINDLIIIHGFLLLVAAAAILFGVFHLLGSLLAMGLLADIILGLWLNDGINDLVIRDLGLMGLAAALALDPLRFWQLERALVERLSIRPRSRTAKAHKRLAKAPPMPQQPSWLARAGAGSLLVAAVLSLSFLLRATGTNGVSLPNSTAAVPIGQAQASPAPNAQASPAPSATATPPTRFADWPYQRYAFQVYPGTIGPDTEKALAGFDLSVQNQGNKVLLVFKALTTRYKDATVAVDKANTAYFIETSMRDDPNNQENDLGDDGVIQVDPKGYIVRS
jgi:hypothetical protein